MRILKSGTFENLFKIAAVPFMPDELAHMRGEGIHIVSDPDIAEPDVMQDVGNRKRDIQRLVGKITLPRVMFPTSDDIVELDDRQYYVIYIAKPQPKKNPEGTVYLLDVETGEPSHRPFMPIANRINSVGAGNVRKSIQELNALITKWNATISKIQGGKVTNPSTWPLQLKWGTGVIDERLADLKAQEDALVQQLDTATNFSPSYSSAIERLKSDLAAGRISQIDLYDTVMHIHQIDPDAIDAILESPSLSEDAKAKIRSLVSIHNEERENAKRKRDADEQEKRTRVNAPATERDIDGMLSPGQPDLIDLTDTEATEYAGKTRRNPYKYFTPHGRAQQIRTVLVGVRTNKLALETVKSALDGMREFIGGLERGERANDLLANTERGTEIKKTISDFVHKARSFIRGYKDPIFVQQESGGYKVNPAILGTTGGVGNGKVAIAINHMLSVVVGGLKAMAGKPAPGVTREPAELAEDLNISEIFDDGYELLSQDVP